MPYQKKKLTKKELNKILSDLEIVESEILDIVNRKIEEMADNPPFQKTVEELVACDDQKIPTQTKLLQNFFNDAIMEIVEKYDLNIVEEFKNGHDYKIHKKPVEYKVTGSAEKAMVASGNKNGGTKSPFLLSMRYKFSYKLNKVTKISTCFIDENSLEYSISGWKDSNGASSWCHFKVANEDMKHIHVINDSITWKRGNLYGQFL